MKRLSFLFISLFILITNVYSQDEFFQPDDLFHIDHMDSHSKEFSLYFKVREKSILAKGENENYINDYRDIRGSRINRNRFRKRRRNLSMKEIKERRRIIKKKCKRKWNKKNSRALKTNWWNIEVN